MENKLRVLIVDDMSSDIELSEYQLVKSGIAFLSKHATNKEEFLKELEDFKPEVVISDYLLHDTNGKELFELWKERDSFGVFIMVTASGDEDVAVEMMKKGVDDYIIKAHLKRMPTAIFNALKKKAAELDEIRLRKELEHKLHNLEIFHEVAVDRELKMIELKKKIEELEEKLKKKPSPADGHGLT